MAFNISYVYKAIDKFTPATHKIKRSVNELQESINKTSEKVSKLGSKLSSVGKGLSAKVTLPLGLMGVGMLSAAATMESMQVSFETMLGSASKAKTLMKDLTQFAAKTPFELTGIGKATKQLLAFGIKQDDIVEKLTMLGDISAGAGVPLSDMAAIFGKIKAKGKAMTEEILQLSDRGIPIIDILGKKYNKTGEEVLLAASKSELSFDMINEALGDMTSKGGIFHNQMIKQSKTLSGLFSTLKDVIFNASAEMGDAIVESTQLKEKMVALSSWIEKVTANFNNLSPEAKNTIVNIGLIAAIVGPLILLMGALILAIGVLGKAFVLIAAPIKLAVFLLKMLAIVIGLNPMTLIIVGIMAAITALVLFRKKIGEAIQSVLEFFNFDMPVWLKKIFGIDGNAKVKIQGEIANVRDIERKAGIDVNYNLTNSPEMKALMEANGRLNQNSYDEASINKMINSMNGANLNGSILAKNQNNTNITGNIVVSAAPGTRIDNTQLLTSGNANTNLGLSLMGGY